MSGQSQSRRLKQLRATPIVNGNAFQGCWTLNNDRVLLDDEVKADVVLELRHNPIRNLAFPARLAHL